MIGRRLRDISRIGRIVKGILEEGSGGLREARIEQEDVMAKIAEIPSSCFFTGKKEMKDKEIEFWVADGFKKLRIFEIDEKGKSFYMINQSVSGINS